MTNTRALTLIFFVLAGLALGIMFPGESSAVFTSYDVNTTADDPGITMTACTAVDPPGPCSLRGAIKGANNHSGADGVTFHIGIGVQTISLASPLEPISDAVTIDGTTQGFHGQPCISVMGKPCIVINGSSAGAGANGLDLATQGITVKGLAIVGFLLTGIRSENQSGNITIVQNFIGTADGATASPNGTGIFAAADNPNYVIERNVISGNTGAGIVAGSGTPINHVIRGNFIGVTASGSGDLGNGGDGVEAIGPHTIGGTVVGAGNVISGNGGIGLRLSSGEQLVQGNIIGLSANGLSTIPNNVGVLVDSEAGGTIGGTDAAARNVVSGNNSYGVKIEAGHFEDVSVQGNYIGTDVTGGAVLGNAGDGVRISSEVSDKVVTIGGPQAGAGNVISGNSYGIAMVDSVFGDVSGVIVQNNYIGLNAAGTATVGNQSGGVLVEGGHVSENNQFIGNVLAGNDTALELDAAGAGGENRNNVISGNLIGLNAAATQVLPGGAGIILLSGPGGTVHDNAIDDSSSPNRISGTSPGVDLLGVGTHDNTVKGNMIDGNGVDVSIGPGVPHNVIESNTITGSATDGISVGAGAHDMVFQSNTISANVRDGFLISAGANHITIDSNTITKNLVGIVSRGDDIIVQRNFIGTNKDLDAGLGNTGAGVFLSGDSNTVGGEVLGGRSAGDAHPEAAAGQGNVILNNGGSGVDMESGTHNSVSRNSIDNNEDIGIKLEGTSNNNEPAPALTSAELENAGTHIQGLLTSSGFFPFTIEFFASPFCDLSGAGEGRDYLGFVTVGASPAAIDATVAAAAPGKVVTATATSDDYNTSQFSNCVTVTGSTPSPSPTPSGSPSHTPTATPRSTIKGDANCDGHVTSGDVLATLSESVHIDPGAACANLANVDCDQDVDAFDALRILDYVAQAPLPQGTECTPIGV